MKLRTQRHFAFTLIELLVVIAIIAILAAILFPVFAQAKKSAKVSTTVSNMKQIVLAAKMYATDHDDYYAMTCNGWPLPAGQDTVYHLQLIYPYTKNVPLHWSGTNPMPGNLQTPRNPDPGHESWGAWTSWTTIAANAVALNYWNGAAYRIDPRNESSIEFLSDLLMYAPVRTENGPGIGWYEFDPFWETCIPDEAMWWWLYQGFLEHNRKVVTGYGDGHVGKKSAKILLLPGSPDPWGDPACVRMRLTTEWNHYYGWYLNGLVPIY
jgi:prepilin-type N-terminal cleavage/methylation domain-containing protein